MLKVTQKFSHFFILNKRRKLMNKTTSSQTSIKDLNSEYARLFEAYGFTKAAKRLKECTDGTAESFTQLDALKLNLEYLQYVAFVTFEQTENDAEYQQQVKNFEDNLRDASFGFLNLDIVSKTKKKEPIIGYLVWDENSKTDDELFYTIANWKKDYNKARVIIFRYRV